jgi:tubulin epsilon
VSFPRIKFLGAGMAPVCVKDGGRAGDKGLDGMFTEVFKGESQLLSRDPKRHTYLACALIVRGREIDVSDVRRNIDRLSWLHRIYYKDEGGFEVRGVESRSMEDWDL